MEWPRNRRSTRRSDGPRKSSRNIPYSRLERRSWQAYRLSSLAARQYGGNRYGATGGAACKAPSSLGRSPFSCRISGSFWLSWSIRSSMGCGWAASRVCTEVFSDPIYQQTVINTLIFVTFGVNLKLFFALLLSGFFMRPGWWVKGLLMIFVLPWAVPALPSFISIHWMLNGEWGLLNNALYILFGVDGPSWLNSRWLALGSAVCSHVWKWLPFWTLILLAGSMSIPQAIYDAAKVDGATGLRRFTHVTFPLLSGLYLVLTLLATIFLLGDFNTVTFITGGGPANSTHLLATLGIRDAFDLANPRLGVAVVMSALPLLIPLVIILMRRIKTSEAQL